jgi:hypothetical protein
MTQREVLSQWEFIDRLNHEDMRGEEIANGESCGADSRNIASGVSMLPHTLRGNPHLFLVVTWDHDADQAADMPMCRQRVLRTGI